MAYLKDQWRDYEIFNRFELMPSSFKRLEATVMTSQNWDTYGTTMRTEIDIITHDDDRIAVLRTLNSYAEIPICVATLCLIPRAFVYTLDKLDTFPTEGFHYTFPNIGEFLMHTNLAVPVGPPTGLWPLTKYPLTYYLGKPKTARLWDNWFYSPEGYQQLRKTSLSRLVMGKDNTAFVQKQLTIRKAAGLYHGK